MIEVVVMVLLKVWRELEGKTKRGAGWKKEEVGGRGRRLSSIRRVADWSE